MPYSMVFAVALVASNVTATKLIRTGIAIGPTEILLPGGILCYAITFLMTDVIGELWGRKQANKIVRWGLFCQILASALISITVLLPAFDTNQDAYFTQALGQSFVLTLASLTAYVFSQTVDVALFHGIRKRFIGMGTKHRWIWNNASTLISQIVDTAIFLIIGFGLGQKMFFTGQTGILAGMFVGQYVVKFLLAILDTPFFYFMTRKKEEK